MPAKPSANSTRAFNPVSKIQGLGAEVSLLPKKHEKSIEAQREEEHAISTRPKPRTKQMIMPH